ncbi:hypothetical protein DRN62_00870 [Nanoarchaeota archaeon]|nr:MAG: hypothetical protein DRN62_00870 [Nanoarchaeota archaeon]
MRRYLALALLFLLSLSFAHPIELGICNINYFANGTLRVMGRIEDLKVTIKANPCDNGTLDLYFEPPSDFESWSTSCELFQEKRLVLLSELVPFPPNYSFYLNFTKYADINEDIRKKASEIVEGSGSTLEAGLRLARWVRENIEYDKSYAHLSKNASWTFYSRKGVCSEFTNLYLAMARSVGIPARYVSGLAYSDEDQRYGPHAWAEFFAGEWIPVDLTFGEFGLLDATHVRLYDAVDGGEGIIRMEWHGWGNVSSVGEPVNFRVNSSCEPLYLDFPFWAEVDRKELSDDDYFLATITVFNPTDDYTILPIFITRVQDALEMVRGGYEDYIILEPKSNSTKRFLFHVKDLDDEYTYKFTLQIYVDPLGSFEEEISVDHRRERRPLSYYLPLLMEGTMNPSMTILNWSLKENPCYGEENVLSFSLKNSGNQILKPLAEVEYGGHKVSKHLGELLISQEKFMSITIPRFDYGEFEARLTITFENATTHLSFPLIFAKPPEMRLEVTNIRVGKGASFYLNASGECSRQEFLVETPLETLKVLPGNVSVPLFSLLPGNNTLRIVFYCYDRYDTPFSEIKYLNVRPSINLLEKILMYLNAFLKSALSSIKTLIKGP